MEVGQDWVSAGKLGNPLAKCVSCAPPVAGLLQDNSLLPLANRVIPLAQGWRSWLQTLKRDITLAFIFSIQRLMSLQNKSRNCSSTCWDKTTDATNPHASGHEVISNGVRKEFLP